MARTAAKPKKEVSMEEALWKSADKLRGSVEPAEYKHVVLSLFFLKFASDKFEAQRAKIIANGQEKFADMVAFYTKDNVFFLPPECRWSYIMENAKQEDIALKIDTALYTIEKTNPALKGALPDNYYSRLGIDTAKLASLLDEINKINTDDQENDIIGRVYEYFLGKFALAEGKGKGEFYTPKCIVNLIAEMIEPYSGILYDPCCGSGGMFVQSVKFVEAHRGNKKNISIYGQEYTSTTYKLAKMNLAIRGISANLGEQAANTFTNDQHKDLKADFIMANPPFNQKEWRGDGELVDDPRWDGYEVPPTSNANYGWILNIVSKLSQNGVAGFLLANGALSDDGTELKIRQQLIENDLVEAIVILPRSLFYTTDISVTLWILNRNKKARVVEQNGTTKRYRDRQGEILFMDLRQMGSPYEKKYIELTEEDRSKVTDVYHNWQQEGFETTYQDQPEFCYAAKRDEVREKGYTLVPSRYIEFINRDENIDFDTKMKALQSELSELLTQEERSKSDLLAVFKELGYAYGLSRIEALCSVSIDDEFENDRCASLLSTLDNMMAENGDAGAELKKVSAKSKLRKYIEFKEEPFQPKEPIVEQFRECLKDISIGTRMKRQDIIELISSRYGTKASSIIPSDYCYNMTNKGIPEDHVSFFLNVGTGLYEYVGENYSLPTIEGVIAAYKADFERVDDQERYKWEAVAHYKQHWNIEAEDFAGMVQEAFRWAGEQYKRPRDGKKDGGNLLTSSMYYPYRMLVTLSTFEPETMRSLFRRLLDEQRPLPLRYEEFRDGCEECRERFQKSDPDHQKANNHYQDLRAISVYLTFEYPEKYFLYKYQMFKQFSDLLGLSSMRQTTKGEKAESALISYNKMCETIVDAVRKDPELQAMSKARLDENCYPDPEFHLLTMDIIYFGSNMTREGTIGVNSLTKQQGQTSNIGKNTILYGPPGTGKTYNTVIYAVAIIEDKPLEEIKSEPYDEVIERYNTYKSEGLIEFTTFHQSYGYEEFIEGIKPRMDQGDGEGSDLEYEICSGLFKSFCEKASQPIARETREDLGLNASPTVWKVSLNGTGNNPVRTECLENGHIRIGWDSYGPSLTDETEYKNKGRVVLNAFINRMKVGDIVLSCFSATTIDAIGVVTGDYEWHEEYGSMMRQRNVKWLVKGIQEDITELNGANMTLASVYKLNISVADVMAIVLKHSPSSTAVKSGTNNYVFIIDEINRGNISKVFGELITLIEPSKRIGKTEGMTVKLPYSGKLFGVPDNVYLIGTMNTADRSIATIDTALRRRFQFKEMQPDPSVLEGVSVEDISIKDMLERMNRKISILYDREHTIGHGYFIPLKEDASIEVLASIFENNIIPLLQEYFYDDYEKIRLVLGDTTKEDEAEQFIVARAADYDELFGTTDVGLDDTVFYQINPEAFDNIDAYRSI